MHRTKLVISLAVLPLLFVAQSSFAQVTVEQALQLRPVQKGDVIYSIPTEDEITECSISSPTEKRYNGWIVKDPAGRLLRKFLDTNGDKDIDLWCYYRDGFEVYRDVDSNFDRKADQYRWFGSQGTRWGIDKDQDGAIDSWKRISAEEVSAEAAAALRDGDASRFKRLLMTDTELTQLGFAQTKIREIQSNLQKSEDAFQKLQTAQQTSFADSQWIHFGGLRPGLIPEGTDGSTKDIVIYENVAALIKSGSQDLQISLGTLVLAGDCWRIVDAPELIDSKSASSFASWYKTGDTEVDTASSSTTIDSNYQKLLEEFQSLDKQLARATTKSQKTKVFEQLSKTISQLAIEADQDEDSLNWSRQFADTITAAVQSGEFPAGLNHLKDFIATLKKNNKPEEAVALVEYRYINADFGDKLSDQKTDVAEAQNEWLENLKNFTEKYPADENVPDAMMQLAMADEFNGDSDKAEKWYQTISTKFSQSQYATKAQGAIKRLNSIGQSMALGGTTIAGQRLNLSDLKGKVVLVHYWADWCELCKEEFVQLEKIRAKFDDLELVGVCCDNDLETARNTIRKTRITWPQFHSEGGYNSGFAAEMGIVSLPSMILIDKNGKIVSTTVSASTLERELNSILK